MVTAFIPVRGGSKSIPLKNIKPLCGKPLVCWNIEALEACNEVDNIVVATDSLEIEAVVLGRNYHKTTIFRRCAENATDTSSTESVILEYLHKANIPSDTTFILVQATSPFTQTIHFKQALEMFSSREYDSLLTCVRNKRFFWSNDGKSLNYDYKKRPRRQDFEGIMMENGAFYINTVKNILESGNRLSGKIGIYEMPEYTAAEIDEPDDWEYIEYLIFKNSISQTEPRLKNIKLFLTDVDGVLTDAGMYYSENGDELKKFNTHDGMGIQILRQKGIKTGIITSEPASLTWIIYTKAAGKAGNWKLQKKYVPKKAFLWIMSLISGTTSTATTFYRPLEWPPARQTPYPKSKAYMESSYCRRRAEKVSFENLSI